MFDGSPARSRVDRLVASLIFATTFAVFLSSPVQQIRDSTFALLLSESLLTRGSFALDGYTIDDVSLSDSGQMKAHRLHQLETVSGHVYYYFPPGGSLLSIPFVALMRPLGLAVANRDGEYDRTNEVLLQMMLAALLMAGLATILYLTARMLLPAGWSALVALGAAGGTQIWSTASRALWSDSWGIALLGVVLWMLLADATGRRSLRPVLLATLLSWMYFVRPTNSIPVVAISIYLLIYHRDQFARYAVTGMCWLIMFLAYAWHYFGRALPTYFRAELMAFDHLGEALAANLISPARGLFIYVPVTAFVIYLLIRYRTQLVHRRLVLLSVAVIVVHLFVISGFAHWHGGHSYGPRLLTGIIPWLALLAMLGLQAMLRWRDENRTVMNGSLWKVQNTVGVVLVLLSVLMNGIGASSRVTSAWNSEPIDIDQQPGRVWDWRHPQFLAPWQQ
jgi:hypothetical protein